MPPNSHAVLKTSGTESWWIETSRSADIAFACADAAHEARDRLAGREQEMGARKARIAQLALDHLGELEIEIVFVDAARADGARAFRRMTHIDDHAEGGRHRIAGPRPAGAVQHPAPRTARQYRRADAERGEGECRGSD